MLTPNAPAGFRQEHNGLIVPSDLARKRHVWTKTDVKQMDRTTKFLKLQNVRFQFCCGDCGPKVPMQLSRDPQTGFKVLSCGCTDRILSGAV